MVELQKGLAWNHEKCKWTGSEANWLPLWCDPLHLRFGGEVNTCRLQHCAEAVTATWWVVWTRHVNHFQRSGKSAWCWSVPALTCQLHPLCLSMKNCNEQLVLIISSMAKTVRNTFILVTHSNIYTFTHIYICKCPFSGLYICVFII